MRWAWCIGGTEPWCLGWLAERLLLPAILAMLVYTFAVRQLKKKRELDYAEKQLAEFYAPMLGARSEILSHTKFDRHMRDASWAADRQRSHMTAGRPVTQETLADDLAYDESLGRFFDKLNARLFDERIDAYIAMRELFARKMAYADQDTRAWYEYFYAFVEMWRVIRDSDTSDPPTLSRVARAHLGLMFDEELLQPFYKHIRERCDYLQGEVSGVRTAKLPAPMPPTISTDAAEQRGGQTHAG